MRKYLIVMEVGTTLIFTLMGTFMWMVLLILYEPSSVYVNRIAGCYRCHWCLAAILLPALLHSKVTTKRIHCAGKVRQLALAVYLVRG